MDLRSWNLVNRFAPDQPWLPLGSFACNHRDFTTCFQWVNGVYSGAWFAMPVVSSDPAAPVLLTPSKSYTQIWNDKVCVCVCVCRAVGGRA